MESFDLSKFAYRLFHEERLIGMTCSFLWYRDYGLAPGEAELRMGSLSSKIEIWTKI